MGRTYYSRVRRRQWAAAAAAATIFVYMYVYTRRRYRIEGERARRLRGRDVSLAAGKDFFFVLSLVRNDGKRDTRKSVAYAFFVTNVYPPADK